MRLSIVIPHRGSALGLWATVQSCLEDLSHAEKDLSYEFVIVSNGEPLPKGFQLIPSLEAAGVLGSHVHSDTPLTPPAARQRGAMVSTGEYLCFLDNHCLVGRDYFRRAVKEMEHFGIDMLHSSTRFYPGSEVATTYHYQMSLAYNFWGNSTCAPESYKPYQCAMGGHGGFVVRRGLFDEVGGYGPESLFKGYGGEEPVFDLKLWRYGKTVWLSPKMIHYHYPGDKGYSRHYSDAYYINNLTSAYVIGGESWLWKVFDSFLNRQHIRINPTLTWWDIAVEASSRGKEYSEEVDKQSVFSLDELLQKFRVEQIAM